MSDSDFRETSKGLFNGLSTNREGKLQTRIIHGSPEIVYEVGTRLSVSTASCSAEGGVNLIDKENWHSINSNFIPQVNIDRRHALIESFRFQLEYWSIE